jgi:hypothetical protein
LVALGLNGKSLEAIAFSKPSASQDTSAFAVTGAPNISAEPPPPNPMLTVSIAAMANLWLAGIPDGSISYGGDTAPAESPAEVPGCP